MLFRLCWLKLELSDDRLLECRRDENEACFWSRLVDKPGEPVIIVVAAVGGAVTKASRFKLGESEAAAAFKVAVRAVALLGDFLIEC